MKPGLLGVMLAATVSFLLQLIVAPNVALFGAMPNFVLVFILVIAILRPLHTSTLVVAFVLGLCYDFSGHGPVGALTFLAVLSAFGASRLFSVLNNSAFSMAAITLVLALLLVELVYSLFLLMFGSSAGALEAIAYRALPCACYDCVFALLFYPLARRLYYGSSRRKTSDVQESASVRSVRSDAQLPKQSKKKKIRF